ncbi:mannose-6-phosphate isomerase, class I [Alkalibacterium sp. f15]|uniref:mannose-6-phosphate isomerase, class I n=1 Tax=Alkalibacterium sp. f15 TaxID=3414029 RepID=UPI003BF7F4C1
MSEPLFFKGAFKEKLWGGKKLNEFFDYPIPSEKTGELWAISAHDNGPSTVINGPYKGKTLKDLWDEHKELFDYAEGAVFPLLTKILDAQTDLSVQVHPDDSYGMAHEGELGKTECWYVIDAEDGAEIVYGHHAQSKKELEDLIETGQWDKLLRKKMVKPGDFFYVPSGTIHAIGGGIMILETQQSSDTTYRVYDYDRVQDNGEKRELHIEDSIAVTTVPHIDPELELQTIRKADSTETTLVTNSFFTVKEWNIEGKASFHKDAPYTLVSVLGGQGQLIIENTIFNCAKGDHFILPSSVETWTFEGTLHMIASHPGK